MPPSSITSASVAVPHGSSWRWLIYLYQASFGPSFACLSSFSDADESRELRGVAYTTPRTKDTAIVRTVSWGPNSSTVYCLELLGDTIFYMSMQNKKKNSSWLTFMFDFRFLSWNNANFIFYTRSHSIAMFKTKKFRATIYVNIILSAVHYLKGTKGNRDSRTDGNKEHVEKWKTNR